MFARLLSDPEKDGKCDLCSAKKRPVVSMAPNFVGRAFDYGGAEYHRLMSAKKKEAGTI